MRIFITGVTGAVGGPVAKKLSERGNEILALVRNDESAKRVVAQGYQPVLGDMSVPERWTLEAARADALIHAAWIRPGRRMGARWLRSAMAADAIAVGALVKAAKQGGRCKALLLTSGHSVYGDHGDGWVDENTTPTPGAIGKKQLACERAAMSAATEGVPCFVIRPCTVYGPSGPSVDFFFGSAAKGVICYPGDGNNFFPFVRDTDLAEAYALAIEKRPIGQAISVGDDEPLRFRDVVRIVLDAFDGGKSVGVPRWLVAMFAGAPLAEMLTESFRVKNSKAKALLGWAPRYPSLRVGVREAVEEWRRTRRFPAVGLHTDAGANLTGSA